MVKLTTAQIKRYYYYLQRQQSVVTTKVFLGLMFKHHNNNVASRDLSCDPWKQYILDKLSKQIILSDPIKHPYKFLYIFNVMKTKF